MTEPRVKQLSDPEIINVLDLAQANNSDAFQISYNENKTTVGLIKNSTTSIDLILTCVPDSNLLLLMLPEEEVRKLVSVSPKFDTTYYELGDNAFKDEYGYEKGNLKKFILDTASKNQENCITIYNIFLDRETGDIVSSVMSDRYNVKDQPVNYLWSLFTNPKYYRKGYAHQLITLIMNYCLGQSMQFKMPPPIFNAMAFIWNTASINLFKKLGFEVVKIINSENDPEKRKTLKKHTYEGNEYTEDQEMLLTFDPLKEIKEKIRNLQPSEDQPFDEITKEDKKEDQTTTNE